MNKKKAITFGTLLMHRVSSSIKRIPILLIHILITLSLISQNASADCVYQSPATQAKGSLEASFKVLTINVYGQSVSSIGDFLTSTDGPCQNRLRAIGRHIRDAKPAYDIVGLQEWHPDTSATCNGVVLKNRIDDLYPTPALSSFYSEPQGFSWVHYRWGHPEAYDQKDGGLGLISKRPFLWENYDEGDFGTIWERADGHPVETANVHQFHPRLMPRSAHGFIFGRIYFRYPDIAVDTYVVHLTSTGKNKWWGDNTCNLKCKQYMLEQLREGIHQRSAGSGFPVLVMGDFNIGGPNPFNTTDSCKGNDGYRDIMNKLGNPRDLWLEANPNKVGTTHGFTNKKPQRIDFMFAPNDPYLVNSQYEISIENNSRIDTIILSNSDHYGIVAELGIRQKFKAELKSGIVTIQQRSTMRYLDAHEIPDKDYRLVTRNEQKNKTQQWKITSLGNDTFTIRQESNGRFVDAHEYSAKDFGVVSRPRQNNDTQRWIIKGAGDRQFTIQQKSSGRYMDAHVVGNRDFEVVTRPFQNNNTQRWLIKPVVWKNQKDLENWDGLVEQLFLQDNSI